MKVCICVFVALIWRVIDREEGSDDTVHGRTILTCIALQIHLGSKKWIFLESHEQDFWDMFERRKSVHNGGILDQEFFSPLRVNIDEGLQATWVWSLK